MKAIHIDHMCAVSRSYRAARVRSLFNVTAVGGARFQTACELPTDESGWDIGLIVGPSGSGKSSIGQAAWGGRAYHRGFRWTSAPVIDDIAPSESVDRVTAALSAVGLGTVPSWLRPYRVLSTGEKFRAELARLLLSPKQRLVVDEFTSVVDRQVARIGAAAFAKAWRRRGRGQVILLSCHRDIIEWVCPDWILDTEDFSFRRGCLQRRPSIKIDVYQTNWRPWALFEKHHYLKLPHMIAATNYVALHQGEPVAHVAVATTTGLKSARMCRLVVLPEWQGAGVGMRFMHWVAEQWLLGNNRYRKRMTTIFHTSHPGLAAALRRSPCWLYTSGRLLGENGYDSRRTLCQSKGRIEKKNYGGHLRAVQGFRYIGEGHP